VLESRDFGHVFSFVPLDAFDDDFGGGAFFSVLGFLGGGFGGLLCRVLLSAFLGVDREGGEVGGECVGVLVEFGVEVGVVGGEPVLAFLGCAAVFAVLCKDRCA
jgi:hypothetical protein